MLLHGLWSPNSVWKISMLTFNLRSIKYLISKHIYSFSVKFVLRHYGIQTYMKLLFLIHVSFHSTVSFLFSLTIPSYVSRYSIYQVEYWLYPTNTCRYKKLPISWWCYSQSEWYLFVHYKRYSLSTFNLDDESKWVYHRRFFLLDRISGVTPTNGIDLKTHNTFSIQEIYIILDSRNVYYAKSIKILYTLSPGGAYLQPPVFVIEYKELVLTDISKGTIAEVRILFISSRSMNVKIH